MASDFLKQMASGSGAVKRSSSFLQGMANSARQKVDAEYGADAYGGSNYDFEEARKRLLVEQRKLSNVGKADKNEYSKAKTPLLAASSTTERTPLENLKDIGTVVGGAILQGADAAATGISSTLDFLVGRPLQALGWEDNWVSQLNDKLQSEREANAEYFSQQLEGNEAAQTALDLGSAVTRAAWELPLIVMTGGVSKAVQAGTKGLQATAALETTLRSSGIGQTVTNAVNLLQRQLRNPQTWQSFASTTGQAYDDAKAQGASEASATAYAVINGLLGSLVEVGGGGIQELPDVLRQPSQLRNWIDTMLDEGKEEVVQGVIDRLTQNVTGVANNPIVGSGDDNAVFNLGTAMEEFGTGALVGGILGGGQIGVDAALNRIRGNASQNATEAPTAGAVPQTGVDTSTDVNPVEAGIDASVRLFNEGGGVIDESTAVNTNPAEHTPAEQRVIEDYQNAVDSGVVNFISRVQTLKNPDYRNRVRHTVSDVSQKEASAVEQLTGVDTTGFKNIITGGAVDHIIFRHGANGRHDHSMADVNDIARIGYVIDNFDNAELLLNDDGTPSTSNVWHNSDNSPASRVRFSKRVNGTYYVVEAVPDSQAKVMAIESAYMQKNNDRASNGTVLNMAQNAPQVTSQTPQRANAYSVNDSILDSGQNVNSPEIPNSSTAVNPEDSLGAAPRGFSVGHAPRVVENQRHAIEGAIPPSQWTEPQRHEVMPERDSLHYAEQRADVDFEGEVSDLRNKERWDAVDTDTAFTILQRLSQRAMETNSEADNDRLAEWQRLVDNRGSAAGSELQARAKWARLAETPELLYAEAVDLLNSPNVRGLSQEQKARVRQSVADAVTHFKSIDPNDTASMIDLIRSLSQTRRTTGLLNNETSRLMNTALNNVAQQEGGAEFLRNIALSQIQNIAQDYRHVSLTERMRTLRALNLLSKPATTLRNLIGNTVFDPLESISNNTGVVFDWLIGQLTGQRTMALDQSWFSEAKRRGSVDALMRSIVEIGLDADAEGVENRYEQGGGRTFRMTGNFIERLLSTWEKINGYMLTSTDEFAKGGVRAEAQRGLEALQERNANVSDEYIASRADEIARQRTFQNDSMLANATLGLRRALNYIPPVGDIGLGDIMLPFARVPANVATQAINYSPAGIVNGIGQFARTMWNARRGTLTPEQQAQAATALGRGLTGTAGIAAFAALALKGILNVAGSDDQDEAALDTGEGMSGTQLNLSALMRLLNGESTEWRDGDQLMSIGFLEPINALMAMGSMVADSYTEDGTLVPRDIFNASLEGTIQSVLDLPAMSSIQELMNAWQYAGGEDIAERARNAALSYAGSQLPGFVVPNLVAGIASGLDNTVRAPYLGETAEDDLVNQFLADIPGLRENVPARLDSWGNERTYSDNDVLNFLNSTILPGSVTQYHTNDVNQEVRRLGTYPSRSAPNDFSVDGQKITLTQEQKDEYQQIYGQTALTELDNLFASPIYQAMGDETKSALVSEVYKYASQTAKNALATGAELDSKFEKAEEFGDLASYLLYDEALSEIEDSKGANTAAFEAVMQDYERMSTQKQNALMEALGENTRFDDVVDAYEAGLSPEQWYTAYDEYKALDADSNASAAAKATDFAKWLDTESGFNERQRSLLEEQFGFYTHLRADTQRYDDLLASGFTPDKANAVYDAVSALQPQTGKTQVSDVQRYAAIAGLNNLTDQEKVAALTEYEGAGSGEKQKFKTAAGYGITPDEFVDFLELREAGDYDYNYSGKGSHNYDESEATDLVNAFLEMYPDTSNQKAAVLWSMVNSSKSGNPYYNFNADMIQWDKAP